MADLRVWMWKTACLVFRVTMENLSQWQWIHLNDDSRGNPCRAENLVLQFDSGEVEAYLMYKFESYTRARPTQFNTQIDRISCCTRVLLGRKQIWRVLPIFCSNYNMSLGHGLHLHLNPHRQGFSLLPLNFLELPAITKQQLSRFALGARAPG